jgi:hypothetical protein
VVRGGLMAPRIDPQPRQPVGRGDTLPLAVVANSAVAAVGQTVRVVRPEDVTIGIGPISIRSAGADTVLAGATGVEEQGGAAS